MSERNFDVPGSDAVAAFSLCDVIKSHVCHTKKTLSRNTQILLYSDAHAYFKAGYNIEFDRIYPLVTSQNVTSTKLYYSTKCLKRIFSVGISKLYFYHFY